MHVILGRKRLGGSMIMQLIVINIVSFMYKTIDL